MTEINFKRPWLILLVAFLLVVIILILGTRTFKTTEKAAFDVFNQRQLMLANEATGGIELYFESVAADMRALGRIPEIQHFDEIPTRRELQRRLDELGPLGVNDVGVLDADGVLRYNAVAHEIEGGDFSWRRYFQEAQELSINDTYIIEFLKFKGVEAGQLGVLVAVPMFETIAAENDPPPSGRFVGVVVGTLKLDVLIEKFVSPIKSSNGGQTFLVDDENNILWAADRSLFGRKLIEEAESFPAFQEIIEQVSAGTPGTAEVSFYKFDDASGTYIKDQEEANLIAYAPIHLGQQVWAIGVLAPQEDARQLIRSAYLGQLIVVVLSILIILSGAFYALVLSFRTNKLLEKEVETRDEKLKETNEELRAALGKLETAHAFLQSIIDGVAEPIVVIGTDYRIKLKNRAAREFSFGDRDVPEPVFCYQIFHEHKAPCSGVAHPCPMEQVRETGQTVTVVHEHIQANGERRFIEIVASPLWGPDGSFQGMIEANRDITERLAAEHELADQARVLARDNDELEDFASKVVKSLQAFFEKVPPD